MASNQITPKRKEELVLRLDATRQELFSERRQLQHRLNPVRKVRQHFYDHPAQLFGFTLAGVATLTSLLRSRKPRKKKPRSFTRFVLRTAFVLAKPAIRMWAVDQARTYLQSQHARRQPDSLLGG